MPGGLVPDLVRYWVGPIAEPGDGFGKRQRRAFGVGEVGRIPPGRDCEEALVGLPCFFRRDIVGLVVGEGLKLAAAGVVVGIILALPLTLLLRSLLFGITATDPVTFLFVSLALVLVAAGACSVPASRALRVDPASALRID